MAKAMMTCPECGARLGVSAGEVGRKGKCPRCGASIQIVDESNAFAVDTPLIPVIDYLLARLRFLSGWPGAFEGYLRVLARLGLTGMLLAGAVALFQFTVTAIKTDSMRTFLMGLGIALGAIVLHYLAARFITAARTLLRNNPRERATAEFMDCMGLVTALLTVALVVYGIVSAVAARSVVVLLPPLAVAIVAAHVMTCFLNPIETMNIRGTVPDASGGETALAIIRTVFRCALVLAPVLLALGVLVGTSWMVVAMILAWSGAELEQATFHAAGMLVLAASLAPVALYMACIVAMLAIDLWSAVSQIMRNTRRAAG